jgi:hypothetical protein
MCCGNSCWRAPSPGGFTCDKGEGVRTVASGSLFNGLYQMTAGSLTNGWLEAYPFESKLYGWLRYILMADPVTAKPPGHRFAAAVAKRSFAGSQPGSRNDVVMCLTSSARHRMA